MASIRQSIRSSTASKRPTSAIADGQIALNTASGTPGMFFKDSAGNIIKTGPAHYGASAPNSSPAVGGSTGNSIAEAWLDSSLTPPGWKIWSGSAWVNATPLSSDTVQGLVELATDAETQAGVDAARAVTAASLQSKVSDSISTTSASGIASSTAVKTAYDLANAALPKSGGIVTGNLEIGTTGSLTFEGSSADGFETTLAVVNPTADRTITFPNVTGTVVTTGDSGTVTSTMIADSTIVNADISTTAAIAFSKLASLTSANILLGNASGVPTATAVTGDVTITNSGVTAIASNVIVNADINSAAAIAYSKLALSSGITNTDISASAAVTYSKLALSNSIVNADINSAAAISGTKISPNFGSQNLTTTGNATATNYIAASGTATTPSVQVGTGTTYKPGIYSPGADQLAISTAGVGRLFVDASGSVVIGTASPSNTAGFNRQLQLTGNLPCISIDNTGTGANKYSLGVNSSGAFGIWDNTASAYRMLIDSSGNVGIGITPSYQLQLSTDSAGKPSTNTWTIVSDERIKEDIELADLSLCYQAVKGIPLKRYRWKDTVYTEEQVHDRHKLGWISQDVKAVFPKAVRISEFRYNQVFSETVIPAVGEELDEDGNVVIPAEPERIEKELVSEDIIEDCHDLNADQLYAAMYGAVQMLMIKVEALEAQVASLL